MSGIIAKLARDWYWWLKFAPFWNHLHETSWHCDSLILSQCQRFTDLQIIGAISSETQFQGLLTFCISAFMETLFYFNYRSNIYFSSCRLDLINKWIDNWTESKWLFEILTLTERIQTKNRKFVITSDMNPVEEVFGPFLTLKNK